MMVKIISFVIVLFSLIFSTNNVFAQTRPTPTATASATPTATSTPTSTPTPTPTPSPTPTPTATPTPTPTPTPTKKITPVPTKTPTPTAMPTVSLTPIPSPTAFPTPQPENHRSAFVRAILAPNEIPIDLGKFLFSGLMAALILLIMFPAELFNSTVQSNYDEIIKWPIVRHTRYFYEKVNKLPALILVTIFALLGALVNSFLSTDIGFNITTLTLVLGLLIAILANSLIYDVSRSIYMKKRFGFESKLRAHSWGLVTGIILVFLSRFANFIPGYCYGIFTALVFKKDISDKQNGEGLAFGAISLLIVGLIGWFSWIPIKAAATSGSPSFLILAFDAAFASFWVSMLTSTVFGLLPMSFMYGETIKKWNSKVWALTYFTGVFLFIYTILNPAVTIYGTSDKVLWIAVIGLFLGFGIFSFLFWGYFRYRK